MPNWTSCKLTVTGTAALIAAFLEKAQDDTNEGDRDFSFNSFVPTPDDIYQGNLGREEEEKYGERTWYNWNCANWGTKWNACDVDIDTNGIPHELVQLAHAANKEEPLVSAVIRFNSAWSPPVPVIDAIFEQHPELEITFAYHNEGGFGGGIMDEDGDWHEFEDGTPEARESEIELKGCDPWSYCGECGEHAHDLSCDLEPAPNAICEDCQAKLAEV